MACSIEGGLSHLVEATGQLHVHLLALDMIPIAALVVFVLLRCLPKLSNSRHPLAKCNLILQAEPRHEKGKPRDAIRKIRYVKELAVAEWTSY